jgi:hypothetical protein
MVAALLRDLDQRGMLDEVLVLVSSEMGRKPKVGDPSSASIERYLRRSFSPR